MIPGFRSCFAVGANVQYVVGYENFDVVFRIDAGKLCSYDQEITFPALDSHVNLP